MLRFGSLNQVINDDDLNRLVQGRVCLDDCMGMPTGVVEHYGSVEPKINNVPVPL